MAVVVPAHLVLQVTSHHRLAQVPVQCAQQDSTPPRDQVRVLNVVPDRTPDQLRVSVPCVSGVHTVQQLV